MKPGLKDIQAFGKKSCCAMSILSSWKGQSRARQVKKMKTVAMILFSKAGRCFMDLMYAL